MNWKKWLGIIAGIALVAFIVFSLFDSDSAEEEAVQVRTEEISRSTISEMVTTQGEISPVDQQELVGQGLVTNLNVAVGDEVSEGDVLAEYMEMGEVTANFDGTVTELNIEEESPDTNAQMGRPSIVVESLNQLEVALDLSQSDAHRVTEEDPVSLNYQGNDYQGTVNYLAPSAKPAEESGNPLMASGDGNNVLEARISFDDDQDLEDLIAGFDIDVDIEVSQSEDALLVPIEALNYDDDGQAFIFTVSDGQARRINIETGLQSDLFIEVLEVIDGELEEGDSVILSPDDELHDGAEVEVEGQDESDDDSEAESDSENTDD